MKKIGRFEVVEELGRGAMGVVYKASDPTIGRLVAIKVLSLDSPDEPGVPGVEDIFMREARAAGRLSHPGIVTIHDALEESGSKNKYIVMEFIPGRTLERVLSEGSPLPLEKILDIVRQIAEALDYAHQQQIIHRDLKPANILLTDEGRVKITDFGIAKILAREGALRTNVIMGTPAYMSPEQVTGAEIDARSDLFALGILIYLMLTGEKPFAGDTAAVMFKIVYEDPVPPSKLRPELNSGHDYLALRSLVKDRDMRYGSAREFLDDLDDVQHGLPPRSELYFPLADIRIGERTLVTRGLRLPWRKQEAHSSGKKWSWVMAGMGVGVVFLLALLGSGVFIYRSQHKSATPSVISAPVASFPKPQDMQNPPTSLSPLNSGLGVETGHNAQVGSTGGSTGSKLQPMKKSMNDSTAALPTPGGSKQNKTVAMNSPDRSSALPASAKAAASKPTASARVVQLSCKFEVQDATLIVSNEAGVVFQEILKGKKKSGLLHLKGGYGGVLSKPFTIPAATHTLRVRVQLKDSTIEKPLNIPSSSDPGTLQILVSADRINVRWASPAHP